MVSRRTLLGTAAALPAALALPGRPPVTWPNNSWPLRIDTWGDSITWGGPGDDRSQTGYRVELGRLLTWAGVPHEPVQDFSVVGWALDNLIGGAVERARGFMPDVIMIGIGTNDSGNASLTASFGPRYRQLLDLILATKPDVKILPAWIWPSQGPYAGLQHNEAVINDRIAEACADPAYAPHILGPMQWQLLPAGILKPDGLHPTDYGMQLMGWQAFHHLAAGLGFPTTGA